MKTRNSTFFRISLIVFFTMLGLSNIGAQVSITRIHRSFDEGWSFKKDNVTNGPEKVSFDASTWRKVDVPHDWSIEDLPNQILGSIQGPFSKESIGGHHTGYTVGGTAWYRKSFKLDKSDLGKIVYIEFDGVYMNSDVWINGHHLGNHPSGYTPFYFNLTPYLSPVGKENVIAVQVKNEGVNSRWYTGSGIYRHVWLTSVNPVHINMWGTYVTTPKVTSSAAAVQLSTTILNEGKENAEVTISTRIIDAYGKIAGTTLDKVKLGALGNTAIKQNIIIVKPWLWSTETPQLYKAEINVLKNGKPIDNLTTAFGVREIQIDAQHGLLVNGKRVILKGGCIHHDYGPLGSAAIDRAEERKIELLKKNGFNAIRCSHNPPSQTFLDICDRIGMLVIDEAFDMWNKSKTSEDYHLYFNDWWNKDLTNMILRDRNHPSIILWSIGNEVPNRADSIGFETRRMLVKRVHELDPSRKVTEAICKTPQWEKKTPVIYQDLDVAGYNYQLEKYEPDHQKFPERVFVGTETFPTQALENWEMAKKNAYVLGNFVWTAIDYIGEVGCGIYGFIPRKDDRIDVEWPVFTAKCGDLDLIGDKNPVSYYRDVVWGNSKIEMFSRIACPDNMFVFSTRWSWPDERKSWTWPGLEGKKMNIAVYTRCQDVKLFLNDKLIGEQKVPEKSVTALFDVPYQPGVLTAKAFSNGKEVCSTTLKTVGKPVAIRLTADRKKIKADRNDLSYVAVEIIDAEGNVVPNADDIETHFRISGNGEIVGVGNGCTEDLSSFQQPKKKVFHGKGLVIVRPNGIVGDISLSATAVGLQSNTIQIKAQ
jgi:beta-galactosidase